VLQVTRIAGIVVMVPILAVTTAAEAQQITSSQAMRYATEPAAKVRKGAPRVQRFADTDAILRFIDEYRHDRKPVELPDLVKAMSSQGLLRDPEKSGLFVGFTAGVLGANPKIADTLIDAMFPLPPQDQSLVIMAIAYSGLHDWKQRLTRVSERMPARNALVRKMLYGKEPGLYEKPLDQDLALLDMLWGYHLATGLDRPVRRIITALAWAKESENIDRLTLAGVAKWTLATNAQKERELLRTYRDELPSLPKATADELRDVIKAAEGFETPRIRKESLAAIEDLKRRNPTQQGKWAKAANIGSVAVAIGCVALAATGQAALGVPCIITGAVTSGAAKLMQDWK
jgi:hypothetical protein